MKKVALAAAVAAVASTAAFAGTIEPPIIEVSPGIIVEETASTSGSGIVLLLLLGAIVFAVAD